MPIDTGSLKVAKFEKEGRQAHPNKRLRSSRSVRYVDHWKWPQPGGYLFPSARTGSCMKKDAVCHSIVKARKSFEGDIDDPTKVRSHSGRHRMINDLKTSSVPPDAGMMFARIRDKKLGHPMAK